MGFDDDHSSGDDRRGGLLQRIFRRDEKARGGCGYFGSDKIDVKRMTAEFIH